jgi:hypothetical protein
MLISKELEGATVERIYWAVPPNTWIPTIGEKFDSFREAGDHALKMVDGGRDALIINRVVFRKPNGTTVDMEVGRERRFA